MAALTTEFLARYSDARVRALTLADNQPGTSYDAAKLSQAATDATQDFQTLCGVVLDTDNVNHVRTAVLLMEAILLEWTVSSSEAAKVRERAEKVATAVAKVTGRDRIVPTSDSNLTVTEERSGQRPAFDPAYMGQYTLNPPGSGVIRTTDA